ncbi:BTB/POZ domain-containing protein 6-like [Paramacrobiotus metropolitanus]|uniref:BTB/POZ domain-containing protein 6-like n=1 Tax=Paramacrobiotus metropolitanus TaxID=2943436 RepID=UPI002445770A|nr:BTB/POZ domain-containing protein 6-like [Paramacrobiotus metropolitanus]
MKQTLARGELSDVRFTVGRQFGHEKTIPAHKFVLSIRSTVFRTMFYGSLPEQCHDVIDIPDIHPDAFTNMLSYMYTDAVQRLNVDNAFHTMVCADKYDLPRLIKVCSEIALQVVDCGGEDIVKECLEWVDTHSDVLLQSEQFTAISRETLQAVLRRNTLTAEEHDIYLAVERWAVAACAVSGMDSAYANRRQVLDTALYLVRFPLLTNAQLANGPGKSGLLSRVEIFSIFMYRNATAKPSLQFPTEPRTGTFKEREQIFVHHHIARRWDPATVTEIHPQYLVVRWCSGQKACRVTPGKVIRSKDTMKCGQDVMALRLNKYEAATTDGFVMEDEPREMSSSRTC